VLGGTEALELSGKELVIVQLDGVVGGEPVG
jgi:hypothetical protein